MKLLSTLMMVILGSAAAAADDWSYICLGATHGCVLAQHTGSSSGADGFYDSLDGCENSCPQIGKKLSWQCTESGTCIVASEPPNPTKNLYPTFQACSKAPGGQCFAPGSMNISYECHGAHFGCIPKNVQPDHEKAFASLDECEEKCHVVPSGMSFGCSGSRPAGCVLLNHAADPDQHYFPGIDACEDWCNNAPGAGMVSGDQDVVV